ncbi:MAG: response regulator [Deltaproteobacteria bacterium]|nr:response regulator [Deltaproteobacteria bacterium]
MSLVLVAEDDVVSRLLISETIKKLGHVPIKAGNGKTAFEFLEENPDDIKVIVTDLMMPEMDGYQLIRKINEDSRYKNIPIIVQSAYLGVKATAKLMEEGIEYVMPKPINTQDLEHYLRILLDNPDDIQPGPEN